MSEKVVITEKQAEAIEYLLKDNSKAKVVEAHFNNFGEWYASMTPLNELVADDFIKAVYIGYEVEPEFLIGDTVIHKETGVIEKVDGYMTTILEKYHGKYRHATPEEIAEEKERRFFARNGREPWELKPKDILLSNYNEVKEVQAVVGGNVSFEPGNHTGLSHLKEYYKVICFAENRLDVKPNGQ